MFPRFCCLVFLFRCLSLNMDLSKDAAEWITDKFAAEHPLTFKVRKYHDSREKLLFPLDEVKADYFREMVSDKFP